MLVRQRWLGLTAVVVVLVVLFVRLGFWQLHRHEQRKAANALVTGNYARAPVPVDTLLAPGRTVERSLTWRAVRAHGTYDVAHTLLVRNQTRDVTAGVDVVVPLVTDSGSVLLVDRGFVQRGDSASAVVELPAPPRGQVDLVGHVHRRDSTARGTQVTEGTQASVAHLDVATVARWVDRPTYGALVDLVSERPTPARAPVVPDAPEVSLGPHLGYAFQWWFFACLAVGGWVILFRRDLIEESEAAAAASTPSPVHVTQLGV